MRLQPSAVLVAMLTACLAGPAAAQVVVQQPVFQQFAAPTTVLVPDRGGAFLGGTGGGGQARSVTGPFPMSRGTASGSGSSSVQVRAYVHDFRAMDEALLGTAAPVPQERFVTTSRPLNRVTAPALAPVAHLRADIARAVGDEAAATTFQARLAAIQRLIDVHDRLAADPRRSRSVQVRGLERRVAMRLVEVHRDLVAIVSWPGSMKTGGEHVATTTSNHAAGGDIAAAQSLIDLIQATVSPETWDTNGGQSSIRYFANGHALVVRAPGDTHDTLGGLLQQLR